jgi:hypothetical protein
MIYLLEIVEGNLKSIMRLILALAAHFKPSNVHSYSSIIANGGVFQGSSASSTNSSSSTTASTTSSRRSMQSNINNQLTMPAAPMPTATHQTTSATNLIGNNLVENGFTSKRFTQSVSNTATQMNNINSNRASPSINQCN